jgi:opacity protein-like surface antigen
MSNAIKSGVFAAMTGLAAAVTAPAVFADDWVHYVGLTGFVFGMEGDSGVGGNTAEVDVSMSDVLDHLEGALTGMVRGSNGTWGYWASYEYMDLGAKNSEVLFPEFGNAKRKGRVNIETNIVDAGLSYNVPGVDWLELMGGIRYWSQDMTLKLKITSDVGGRSREITNNENWTDGFVGIRATMPINDCWNATLRLDGGTGDSDSTYQAIALLNYAFAERWISSVGYRYLKVDYEDDGFLFDMEMSGIEVAISYRF